MFLIFKKFFFIFKMFSFIKNSASNDLRRRLTAEKPALFLLPSFIEVIQTRERKRSLKRTLSKEERLARRLKREEKEAKKKQYTFMERVNIRRMQKL